MLLWLFRDIKSIPNILFSITRDQILQNLPVILICDRTLFFR